MREILFRGKRVDNGEWIEGCFANAAWYLDDKEMAVIFPADLCMFPMCEVSNYEEVDLETVGQFTGLIDKNDKRIFEGDILKSDDLYEEPLSVIFNENCGAFQVLFKDGYSDGFLEQYTDVRHIEVIGNIHDNPELLGDE